MTKLRLPFHTAKSMVKSKGYLLSSLLIMMVLILTAATAQFGTNHAALKGTTSSSPSFNSNDKGCCGDVSPTERRMIGTFYTIEDQFTSTLTLNNKGPQTIEVTLVLYSMDGRRFAGAPITVSGTSSQDVDLGALAVSAGPGFESGSFEFTYPGRLMEIGGGLRIVSSAKGLIFDEQTLEPGMKFSSSQLDGVFGIPFRSSRVRVMISNTTSQPLAVDGKAIFVDGRNHFPVSTVLGPHETQVLELPKELTKRAAAGAVSLAHDGGAGALLAMIHLQESKKGFSASINLSDPSKGKSTQYHGAGLRLGVVGGEPLTPLVVVRNTSGETTTVTGRVPITNSDGEAGLVELPPTQLAAGELKLINTSDVDRFRGKVATAGLELEYTGAPGSVIASAFSSSSSGDHVFTLPLEDPQGGLSSTGGYPWFIDKSASTTVLIKNTTNEAQEFTLDLFYPGGLWGSNLRTLGPHETFALDVRAVRDSQEPGSEGNTIPPDATVGHVSWSVRGNRNKTLIGRAQTVDVKNGLVSTYACQCLCGSSFAYSQLSPSSVVGFPGDVQLFLAQQKDYNCFGQIGSLYNVGSQYVEFSSSNTDVATVNGAGECTALEPGETYIGGSWWTGIWEHNEYAGCVYNPMSTSCGSPGQVQCRRPTNETTASGGWVRISVKMSSVFGRREQAREGRARRMIMYLACSRCVKPPRAHAGIHL